MTLKLKHNYILLTVALCALIMGLVDGVLQPGYAVKSAIKIFLFLGAPAGYLLLDKAAGKDLPSLFRPRPRDLLIAGGLGLGVLALILGGYFLLREPLGIDQLALTLTANSGVDRANFLWVSLYICFVNSLLEEILFRGFAFITLKRHTGRAFAYCFSALTFAVYHLGMFTGSALPIVLLATAALFAAGCALDFLNEKSGNIYVSWLVHLCANLGINTVGYIVFGMI